MRVESLDRIRNLILLAAMLVGTVILAASLGTAELQSGTPLLYILGGLAESLQGDSSSGARTVVLAVVRVLIVLYLYALIPLGILYTLLSPNGRKRLRRALAFTPIIFLLAYRFLRSDLAQRFDLSAAFENAGRARPEESIFVVTSIPSPPEWLGLVVSGSLTLLFAAAAWYIWKWVRPKPKKLDAIAEEARYAAEEIAAGRDFKDTILRCYYQMGVVLQERKILRREAAMTPREFELRLRGAGLPDERVAQLTRLFERVRYGGLTASDAERQAAVECLQSIAGAVEVLA